MAEVTLSPIPYNGGTLPDARFGAICRLDSTRYLTVHYQSLPDYVFGTVYNITGIKTASPSVSVARSQVIKDIVITSTTYGIRAYAMSDERVIVIWNTSTGHVARLFNVDKTTNVITALGSPLELTTYNGPLGHFYNYTYGNGVGQVINSTTLLVGMQNSTTVSAVKRIAISGDTLSYTDIATKTSAAAITVAYYTFDAITNTSLWSCSISATTATTSRFTANQEFNRFYGDPTSAAAWTEVGTSVALASRGYLPLTTTTGLYLADSNTWQVETNRTLGAAVDFGATAPTATTNRIMWAKWLSDTYFIISVWAAPSASTAYDPSVGRYYKVVQYINGTTGQTSSATSANTIITSPSTTGNRMVFPNSHNNGYDFYDGETILMYGALPTDLKEFRISTLYAPN